MDFGIDTLVYIIIGVIFVAAQASRKRNVARGKQPEANRSPKENVKEELSAFWKAFLGTDLTANQVPEPAEIQSVPPVFTEPADFLWKEPAKIEPVYPKSSLTDPGVRAVTGLDKPVQLTETEVPISNFDLRSAVVYSVILERKYV
jgi:hypothetical protein